jgi:hypothetical protein
MGISVNMQHVLWYKCEDATSVMGMCEYATCVMGISVNMQHVF